MPGRGFPLRPTLVTGMIALIFLAAGTVGASAYFSSRRAVHSLFTQLASELSQRVTQRTLRFLEPAVPYVALTQQLAAAGKLDPHDPFPLLDYFHAALVANPTFTWASFGDIDGTYLSAYRSPTGEMRATLRETARSGPSAIPGSNNVGGTSIISGTTSIGGTTIIGGARPARWREFTRGPSGWTTVLDTSESYDPRDRPWYQGAVKAGHGVWNEPFLFASNQQPGFTYSAPYLVDGVVRGVWDVEFEVSALSQFLATLRIGDGGRVYIVSRSGLVVGHPRGALTEQIAGHTEVARAADAEPRLARAFLKLGERGGPPAQFAVDDTLVFAEAFPREAGIDWTVLGVAPEADFVGEARAQAVRAALIGAACALVAALLGALFASRVASGMRDISEQMESIGRFELVESLPQATGSVVREVNQMVAAAERMKSSLRSFGKYVPRELVQELLASGKDAVLGGQKQELTTLFSDIEGFTTISEKMEPDALVDALGEYFAAMSEEIRRCDGTVDKYIGDAIMAFWGAPLAQPDHAVRACRAALAMRARLDGLQQKWAREGRPAFQARIGINTGATLVGNIGSPERMNYTVMGDAVNLASRLEGLNKSYGTSILIGERTAALVQDVLTLRPLDWVAVKGRARAVLVHELISDCAVADPRQQRVGTLYGEALQLYRTRQFGEAAERFEQVSLALGTPDGPSRALALRCRGYCEAPPPQEWDGSHAMTIK